MSRKKGQSVGDKRLPAKLRLVDSPPEETGASRSPLGVPSKPEWISERSQLSANWDDIVTTLGETGVLTKADGAALELALMHYETAHQAGMSLLEDGSVIYDKHNGREQKHPASTILAMQSRLFLDYAKQLGLTFVSRARVDVPEGKADDFIGGNPFAIDMTTLGSGRSDGME